MKKIFITVLAALFLTTSIAAQQQNQSAYVKDFDKKIKIAEKLLEYDRIAWITSDAVREKPKEVLEKLGADWFCFKDEKGMWNAMYGKYDGQTYTPVLHFVVDNNEKITEIKDSKTTPKVNLHANALNNARTIFNKHVARNAPGFNQYIWQNQDKTFTVWILPAFQPDGSAVYGGEAEFLVGADGKTVKRQAIQFQKEFRVYDTRDGGRVSLAYPEMETSPLEAIFFTLYYRNYFESISIKNKKYTSGLLKVEGNNFTWFHIEKENEEPNEKKSIAQSFKMTSN